MLANAVDQLMNLYLAHRIREQVRSHILISILLLDWGYLRLASTFCATSSGNHAFHTSGCSFRNTWATSRGAV